MAVEMQSTATARVSRNPCTAADCQWVLVRRKTPILSGVAIHCPVYTRRVCEDLRGWIATRVWFLEANAYAGVSVRNELCGVMPNCAGDRRSPVIRLEAISQNDERRPDLCTVEEAIRPDWIRPPDRTNRVRIGI